jgi:predicted CXXCH cytochrome family protein
MLSLLTIGSGCDRHTQYAILTTVFTGVPPMEELFTDKVREEKAKQEDLAEKSRETLYQHPLWAANQCTACHEAGADGELKRVEAVESELPEPDPAKGMPVGLILPPDKLCIKCHLDKTARRAIRGRLWLHNPVAQGDCLSCHSKHQSPNQAHLRLPLREICSSCHKSDQLPDACLEGSIRDQPKNNCLNCHNTHMGRDRFLLTRDYQEIKIVAGPVPEPVDPQDLPSPQSE